MFWVARQIPSKWTSSQYSVLSDYRMSVFCVNVMRDEY